MFRTIVRSALVVSIAAGGTLVLTALPASAKTIITAGAGSSASCTTQASAKLAPALKNNWTAAPGDSVPAVAALPTTVFASNGPVVTTAKGTGTCSSGTATSGALSAPITGIKKLTVATDPANPGSSDPATCASLLAGGSTALFNETIEWTSGNTDAIANTTVTDSSLSTSLSPIGFKFSGGTISGSFAGGTISSISPVSDALIAELTQAQETGAQAQAASYTSLGCTPTLKLKTNKLGTTATLKAPKGLKAITITNGSVTASA
jgi:hypothetical protein